jgi:toxin FitB
VNVVDSSGWLEYFAGGPAADFFAESIEATDQLIVPVICVYEVFKRVCQQRDEGQAIQAVALMQEGRVIELTPSLALDAARTSLAEGLPMADSIILATARAHNATLWTQDGHFLGKEGVMCIPKEHG